MSTNCFILKTYAKINLTLDILGIREDGFHLLRSTVVFINIFDTILVEIGKDGPITFYPKEVRHSNVHKLKHLINIPFSALIYKNIPISRGLGGSSSNVGGLLGLFVHLGLFERKKALNLAQELGADVTMYLYNAPLLMEGIGEIITSKPELPVPKTLYVIIPDFKAETPMMYRAWDEKPIYTNYTTMYIDNQIMGNALKEPFERVFNIYLPSDVYLTGSGSAMFTLSPPSKIINTWNVLEVNTRTTGWEMIACEDKN